MAGNTDRKIDSDEQATPNKKGDPADNGTENRGKGKPSRGTREGFGDCRGRVGNSAHGRWK